MTPTHIFLSQMVLSFLQKEGVAILDSRILTRTVLAGALLAMFGIGMFALLWVILGSIGASQFARVVLSVCIPPILMAGGVGIYFLVVRPAPRQE
jgi:hypothetical protein